MVAGYAFVQVIVVMVTCVSDIFLEAHDDEWVTIELVFVEGKLNVVMYIQNIVPPVLLSFLQ